MWFGIFSLLRMTFLVCSAMALAELMGDPVPEQCCCAGSDTTGWEDVQKSEWEDPKSPDNCTCKLEFSSYYLRSIYFLLQSGNVPLVCRIVSPVSRNERVNEMKQKVIERTLISREVLMLRSTCRLRVCFSQ